MGKYLVGLDEGTTGCKACVFDFDGKLIGEDYREYACYYPQPGWVEQKAEDITPELYASVKQAIINSKVDPKEIVAIGLSSQAAPCSMIDEEGNLLRDFIGWQDVRAQKIEQEEILSKISHDEYYEITGDPLGFTLSAARIIWMKNHEPELWKKMYKMVTHQEYFLKEFGADDYYTDLSSASRMSICDVNNHKWSDKMLKVFEMREDQLAKIETEPGKVVGKIDERLSELTGLPVGCNVSIGAHDQNCSTFGGGLVNAGDAVMVMGTFGSCFVCMDAPNKDPNKKLIVKGNHGIGNWTIEAFSNTAASSFRWFRDALCDLEKAQAKFLKDDPYNLITRGIEREPIGANGVVFLPFLQGAAGHRNNPNARGTLLNIDLGTTRSQIARAVLEGICFEMYDIILAEEAAGIEVKDIRFTGGAAKSPFWCQMLADMTGKRIMLLQTSETGCLGAAMYAGIGSKIYKDAYDAAQRAVNITKVYEPNPDNKASYDEAFEKWTSAYEALNGRFYK